MVKWVNVRSKQSLEIKGVRCIYLKVIMIKSDTYNDTQTHYLVEQDLLLLQDRAGGMDTAAADKWVALEEKRGPPGPCSSHLALDTPCLGPVGLET